MKYAFEDLSPEQFEKLIINLCQTLLGISVQGFSKGPDGGRDATFVGTAEIFPSKSSPWKGTVIIQAKHTNGYNKCFSESDFFNPTSLHAIVSKEIPKIKKLREEQKLDHYMLFSNRRLAANTDDKIKTYISEQCAIPKTSLYLCGVEQLEIWLNQFPDVTQVAGIDPVDSPLIVSSDDLAEIIQVFKNHLESIVTTLDHPPTPRVFYEDKNQLNAMSEEYAKVQRNRYLKETAEISTFLAAPENAELLQLYMSVIEEFEIKIIAKRKNYQAFDEVMEYLVDLLFNRDAILRKNKRLTRTMLFYMYWNCDIGVKNNDTTN